MKSFFVKVGFISSLLFCGVLAHANDYSVTVSSAVPTASAGDYTANGGPIVSGNVHVRALMISNYLGASVQNVTVYDNCTSNSAAVVRWVIPVASSSTYSSPIFPAGSFTLASPCISKTDANSTVKATLIVD